VRIGKVGHLREDGRAEGSQGLNNDLFLFLHAAFCHDIVLLEKNVMNIL
jgi:hypothetical protein